MKKVITHIAAAFVSLAVLLPIASSTSWAQAPAAPKQEEEKLNLPDGMTEEQFKQLPPQIQQMIRRASSMNRNLGDPEKLTPAQYEKIYDEVWTLVAQRDVYSEHLTNWWEWRHKFKGKLTTLAATESAIQEMLQSLGEHWTAYTSSADIKAAQERHKSGLLELGISVTDRPNSDGTFNVFGIHFDTPAYRSTIRKGDKILRIKNLRSDSKTSDWQSIAGMTKAQVEDLLRGPAKTPVFVEYSRNNGAAVQIQLVVMEPAERKVKARMAPNGVCHVWMPQFDEESIDGFMNGMLNVLENAQGNYRGCVIDFRGNPGGLFEHSKKIAAFFLPEGFSVSTKTRDGREEKVERIRVLPSFKFDIDGDNQKLSQLRKDVQKMRCVVLIDESSASASEVVTGILKGNRRCVVVGTKSWGKGMGFFPMPLPLGGQLTISSLIYYPPDPANPDSIGIDINGVGIHPDIVVERVHGDLDNQLEFAMDLILKDNGARMDEILKKHYPRQIDRTQSVSNPFNHLGTAAVLAVILIVCGGVVLHLHLGRKRRQKEEEQERADRNKGDRRY